MSSLSLARFAEKVPAGFVAGKSTCIPFTKLPASSGIASPYSDAPQRMPSSLLTLAFTVTIRASMRTCFTGTSKSMTNWRMVASCSGVSRTMRVLVRSSTLTAPLGDKKLCCSFFNNDAKSLALAKFTLSKIERCWLLSTTASSATSMRSMEPCVWTVKPWLVSSVSKASCQATLLSFKLDSPLTWSVINIFNWCWSASNCMSWFNGILSVLSETGCCLCSSLSKLFQEVSIA